MKALNCYENMPRSLIREIEKQWPGFEINHASRVNSSWILYNPNRIIVAEGECKKFCVTG